MEVYLTIFLRIIFIMLLLIFATIFIMGKRPIGELPVIDFLSVVVMGSVVGADIADPEIEHLPTAFAVVVLAVLQRVVSIVTIKSKKAKKLLTFEPTIIIRNGKLIYKNIRKSAYPIDDILMMLRENQVFDISKIEYAIIEASGNISFIKKPQYETVTLNDVKIQAPPTNLAVSVIVDGELQKKNIELLNTTEQDILSKLKAQGFNSFKEIFYASMDFQGNLNVSSYQES